MLEDEDINPENEIKDLKVKDDYNIMISTTDSYLHLVTIVYKY